IAVFLGAVGFTQINTPLSRIALFVSPTATSIATSLPTKTKTPTRTLILTLKPTLTPTSTFTRTPSPTATATATNTPTRTATPTRLHPTKSPAPSETPSITDTPAPVVRTAHVPILMYHYVGDLPPDADAISKSLTVSRELFQQEIKFLADQGYTTIHIADLINYLNNGTPLPPKPIILTFDDGYADQYEEVFPTLKDFHMVGTFFILVGPTDFNSAGYLSWDQILEMANNGMEIGSHGQTHRYNLGTTFQSTQRAEIIPPDQRFREKIPNWIPIFSYPSGSYNQYTLDLLQQLGYVAAVTTKQGTLQSSEQPL